MNYSIETKQVSSLKGVVFSKREDVIDAIKMFDLFPPFKIFEGGKTDVTSEFLSLLGKESYPFIDTRQVAKKLPVKLKKVMNENYRANVEFDRKYSLKLVTEDDVKSIKGFYELWEDKCITIGTIGKKPVFFNTVSKSISVVNDINDISKCTELAKTVDDFLLKLDI